MQPFTAGHRKRLSKALVDAYQTVDNLQRLVQNELDVTNLETIVPLYRSTSEKVAEDLVRYYMKRERGIQELVAAAVRGNRDHGELQAIAKDWQGIDFQAVPSDDSESEKLQAELDRAATHPLAGIRTKSPPTTSMEDFQSVLFRPADTHRQAITEPLRSIEAIQEEWEGADATKQPLTLIMDFPIDVQQTLLALAEGVEQTIWIDGQALIDPHSVTAWPKPTSRLDEETPPPALLVVDFSTALPDRVLPGRSEGEGVSGTTDFETRLYRFLDWAKWRGHQVTLGLPRYVLGNLNFEMLKQQANIYESGELYSPAYQHRAEYCQELLGHDLPLGKILFRLLSANSNALPQVSARILSELPIRGSFSDIDDLNKLTIALELSRRFTEAGFYEIAYRLESYCRCAWRQKEPVSLMADLHFSGGRQKDSVVGFVELVAQVPAMIKYGSLTGDAGAGKTTALFQIEQQWSLPQLSEYGVQSPSYIPLYVTVSSEEEFSLSRQIEERINLASFRLIESGNQSRDLACHTLIGKLGSLENLRWLFSSPLYLLLDDIDQLSLDNHYQLERELNSLRTDNPEIGVLLTFRDGTVVQFVRLNNARIRQLDEDQVEQILKEKGRHRSLLDLLDINDKPISSYLRNPYLLDIICELDLTGDDLVNVNLGDILRLYVENGRRRIAGRLSVSIIEDWLPPIALKLKLTNRLREYSSDAEEQNRILAGRQMGILREFRDRNILQFRFGMLRDCFAAKQLVREVEQADVGSVLEKHLDRTKDEKTFLMNWRNVLKILVGYLEGKDADRLIEFVCRNVDLCLAHECALELSTRQSLPNQSPSTLLVQRIEKRESELASRIKDAQILSYLDPRIASERPLQGLLDVQQSKQMGSFKIGKYPVTNIEFARFVLDDGYHTQRFWNESGWNWLQENRIRFPRYWRNSRLNQANYPVVGVNYYEASAYCAWLTDQHRRYLFDLPTAAEWDRAAHGTDRIFELLLTIARETFKQGSVRRGKTSRRTFAGSSPLLSRIVGEKTSFENSEPPQQELDDEESVRLTEELISRVKEHMTPFQAQLAHGSVTPVGIFAPNKLGCFDLFGNVWQWCNTALSQTEQYEQDLFRTSQIEKGSSVVVKGGSTSGSYDPTLLLMGGWFDPSVRFYRLGFRVKCRIE
jgi:formylglycine-generating enzyme required for sulfatase activity